MISTDDISRFSEMVKGRDQGEGLGVGAARAGSP